MSCASARSRPTPRSSNRRSCRSACRCWWPHRARSAARRFRIAARSAATSRMLRRPAIRCRCWPPPTRASSCAISDATRTVPFDSYYTGYRKSVRQPDELIVAIEIPRIDGAQWWRKVGTRRAQAISKIMIGAACADRDVRIAFGSVAPTVVLAANAAAVLSRGGSIGRRAGGAAARDLADRRCAIDGGVSGEGGGEPARAVLEGDRMKGASRCGCVRWVLGAPEHLRRHAGRPGRSHDAPRSDRRWRRRCRFRTAMKTARCRRTATPRRCGWCGRCSRAIARSR